MERKSMNSEWQVRLVQEQVVTVEAESSDEAIDLALLQMNGGNFSPEVVDVYPVTSPQKV